MVGVGRGLFEDGIGGDHFAGHQVSADAEMLERALSLRSPKLVGRYCHITQAVGFHAYVVHGVSLLVVVYAALNSQASHGRSGSHRAPEAGSQYIAVRGEAGSGCRHSFIHGIDASRSDPPASADALGRDCTARGLGIRGRIPAQQAHQILAGAAEGAVRAMNEHWIETIARTPG